MKRGDPFKLDILLVSDLNQEGFHPRQTFRDGLHDGGHHGRNSSTSRRVLFRHSGHSTRSAEQPVCCLAHIATLCTVRFTRRCVSRQRADPVRPPPRVRGTRAINDTGDRVFRDYERGRALVDGQIERVKP
jgi:hypothetical protein